MLSAFGVEHVSKSYIPSYGYKAAKTLTTGERSMVAAKRPAKKIVTSEGRKAPIDTSSFGKTPKRNPARHQERMQSAVKRGKEEGRTDFLARRVGKYPEAKFNYGYNHVQGKMSHARATKGAPPPTKTLKSRFWSMMDSRNHGLKDAKGVEEYYNRGKK
jgi:hypothetical protein